VIDIRTLLSSELVVSVRSMKLCSISIIRFVSARSGFLWPPGLRPHRFCSHNGPLDKTVDAQRAISQTDFYRRCVHVIRLFVELTSRDHLGLLYYGYSAAQLFWEAPLADRLCSVIWNLNLVNVIVLFVRHFLPTLYPIALSPFCSAPLPGDKCKTLSNICNFVNTNQNASPM
jgi:hypothetical protein